MPVSSKQKKQSLPSAYVVTVDMGYGHQRAVYPLQSIAALPDGWTSPQSIITANNYAGIPKRDRSMWEGGRTLYETVSRMKRLPIIGQPIFDIMDYMQRIEPLYPKRDLSEPTAQVKQIYWMIKRGWGSHLIQTLNKQPLPYVTSFFTTAFFAEEHGYADDIYCLCTDTDISRAWVPLAPKKSRIIYCAPNYRVKERLLLYGIKESHIVVTGFPLPKELVGGIHDTVVKKALGQRISLLDPHKTYQTQYQHTIAHYVGTSYCTQKKKRPLTLMFAVGGAGAQRELGATIYTSLKKHIKEQNIRLFLVAGSRNDVYRYYADLISKDKKMVDQGGVSIIYAEQKNDYFAAMNKALLETDILWTKPSELSFYAGLGIPIIMSPTIGSQEDFNKSWLLRIGAGFEQLDARYTHEWLFDWVKTGQFASAAMQGYLNAPQHGTDAIEQLVMHAHMVNVEQESVF